MTDLATTLNPGFGFDEAVLAVTKADRLGDLADSQRRKLLRLLHPDTAPSNRRAEAEDAISPSERTLGSSCHQCHRDQ